MALSEVSLQNRIESELSSLGFKKEGPHAWVGKLAEAIAKAVVAEIVENARAKDAGGTSPGNWPIE